MKATRFDATIRYIFLHAKFWGMFPFYLADGWKLHLSKMGYFQSFLMLTTMIYCLSKTLYLNSKHRIYRFIFVSELFLLHCTVISSFLMVMSRYQRLSDALTAVLFVQRRYGVALRCKRYLIQISMCSLVLFVSFLLRVFEPAYRSWNNTMLKIAFFLPSWMLFSSIAVFSSVCLFIGDSFVLISAAARKPFIDLPEVDFLLQAHFLLVTAVDSLNACYGIQNLLFFITTYFFFTSSVYTILTGQRVFYILMAIIFYPFMCWDIVRICNETKKKAQMFTEALYESALFGKHHLLTRNTKIPFHFATVKDVRFSACGMFNISYNLIFSMIAGATSYLLILFQFSNTETNTPTSRQ